MMNAQKKKSRGRPRGRVFRTFTISLTDELIERLRVIADNHDRSVSSLVRIFLTKAIEENDDD